MWESGQRVRAGTSGGKGDPDRGEEESGLDGMLGVVMLMGGVVRLKI